MNHRKTTEEAFQDIATFMHGLRWWKNDYVKQKVFVDKCFLGFESLKLVWRKMADNSSENGRVFTTSKNFSEIFQEVVGEIYQFEHRENITLEEMLCLATSEKLKTINK